MSDMPAFCAAFGSFQVKSSSTSFTIVLITVRVLPFVLRVTFIRSDTLMVSTFGARWYTDQRYRSMQISATRHSSGVSTELSASFVQPCTASGVLADATCTDGVSDRGIGRGTGKAALTIVISVTETPSSPIAAWGASMDVAPPSIGAPALSMRSEPKSRSPAATQPERTTVPHNATNAASLRGLITSSLPVSFEAPALTDTAHPGTRRVLCGSKYGDARKKTAGYHLFRNVLPECNSTL